MHSMPLPMDPAPSPPPRMSVCAVASLVLGLVLCCPLTSLAAIVLGAVGLNATKARMASGRGLAIAGLALGLVGTALQVAFGAWSYTTIYAPLMQGPAPALRAGLDRDAAAMVEQFVAPEDSSLEAEATAFLDTVKSRYGSLVACELDRSTQAPTPDSKRPEFEADFEIRFERATIKARSCTLITTPDGRLSMKLRWIELIDPALGDLRFPAAEPKKP
ncbi:MAG: hypothetical protein RJA05_1494 [Planctomycetota bacterium]